MQKGGFVYIMTNAGNSVLYTGVTSRFALRIHEHRTGYYPLCFTNKYKCYKLVWFTRFDHIEDAITEEKRIKDRSRKYKLGLIDAFNPGWHDLWEMIKDW